MRIHDRTWMQIEEYLQGDDRIVLPLGSTEQHGYLSLGVDAILSERVAVEAAEPLGVPVLPSLPYGLTPYFAAYPGSPTLRAETYLAVVRELLESLYDQGFRRVLVVNGHGGNSPAAAVGAEFMRDRPRRAGALPQLVERAARVGGGAVGRPGCLARLVARELPLDARRRRRDPRGPQATRRRRRDARRRPGDGARAARRRLLRRRLRPARRRLAGRVGGGRGEVRDLLASGWR